jgi:carnitine O-palmitoyltransferase 1
MAEAHSAVAFSFSVTPEGVNVKLNHEALSRFIGEGILKTWRNPPELIS